MTISNRLSFENDVSVICKKINNQFNVMLRIHTLELYVILRTIYFATYTV